MQSFRVKRAVPHTAANMFALVKDVERYPEFLPLCQAIAVRSRTTENDIETVVADMTVAYKMFHETFTTQAIFDPKTLDIRVSYLTGPFRQLDNTWRFLAVGPERCTPERCTVDFFIAYEFRSRTMQMMMGAMFDRAFRKFADAFEARADAVYGRPSLGQASVR